MAGVPRDKDDRATGAKTPEAVLKGEGYSPPPAGPQKKGWVSPPGREPRSFPFGEARFSKLNFLKREFGDFPQVKGWVFSFEGISWFHPPPSVNIWRKVFGPSRAFIKGGFGV